MSGTLLGEASGWLWCQRGTRGPGIGTGRDGTALPYSSAARLRARAVFCRAARRCLSGLTLLCTCVAEASPLPWACQHVVLALPRGP